MTRQERLLRELGEVDLGDLRVVRLCRVCYQDGQTLETERVDLLSPRGVVHQGEDYGETYCGRDATGPGWWWRL